MKNRISIIFLLTLAVLFTAYSCKEKGNGEDPYRPVDSTATEVEVFECLYFGNNNLEGDYHIYRMRLVTKGLINWEGKVVKAGLSYSFVLSSKAPSGEPAPNVAIYSLKDNFDVQGLNRNYTGIFEFNDDGNKIGEATITEGELTVETDKVTFKGKDSNGKSHNIVYKGTFTTNTLNKWTNEPTTPENVSFTLPLGDFIDYGDFFHNNTKNIYVALLDNAVLEQATKQALFEFVLPKDVDTIPHRTYTVASTKEEGTLLASTGMVRTLDNYMLIPSAVWDKTTNKVYYIASGTAVVSHRQMVFNGQSHFGSTVNVSYSGGMTFRKPNNTIRKTIGKGIIISNLCKDDKLFFDKM